MGERGYVMTLPGPGPPRSVRRGAWHAPFHVRDTNGGGNRESLGGRLRRLARTTARDNQGSLGHATENGDEIHLWAEQRWRQ